MEAIETLNQTVFLALNATPSTAPWLVTAGLFTANHVILLVPAMLVTLWLAGGEERRALAVRACLISLLALGINQLIGMAWYHPRPFVAGIGYTVLAHDPDSSFPSDHATFLFAIALTFLSGGRLRPGLFAALVGVTVSWARIFVGVHWPLDIVGAVAVAALACMVGSPLWRIGGMAVTRVLIAVYRKVLARPIARQWLRP